jgi:hypothetical protein
MSAYRVHGYEVFFIYYFTQSSEGLFEVDAIFMSTL